MKKTLITLLALAGVACGVTLDDAMLTSTTGAAMDLDAEGMSNLTEYTLTMNVNADALVATIANAAPKSQSSWIADIDVSRTNGQALHLGPGVVIASSSNTSDATIMGGYAGADGQMRGINFNVSDGSSTITYLSSIVSSAWGYDAETGTSDISSAVISMTGTAGSNCSICITMKKDDGSILEYYGTTSGYSFSGVDDINGITFNTDIVESAYFFDSVSTETGIKALHAQIIPEPATATLSLLALAGLAIRRRRK